MLIRSTILSAAMVVTSVSSASAARDMPIWATPVPQTTNDVPHLQIVVAPEPEISAALLNRVARIPGVDIRKTVISRPGALGFWIKEDVTVARPNVIVGGREFAHMHPDGSLLATLPSALAKQALRAGWATSHPWANERHSWKGVVMIFTPTSMEELDLAMDLVQASHDFVTGQG